MRQITFTLTVRDNHRHMHKIKGVTTKGCTTTLMLDDGNSVTLVDRQIEEETLISVISDKGSDYFVIITRE